MSSTARGGQRSPADFYETPAWATYHAVFALRSYYSRLFLRDPFSRDDARDESENPPLKILEPCAGGGAIIQATNAMLHFTHPWLAQAWRAVEPNEQSERILRSDGREKLALEGNHSLTLDRRDFFSQELPLMGHDLIIMNPPFRLAMEFIEACLPLAPVVACLLRLNFLGSDDRNSFFRKNMPSVFVIPNRISFISPDIKLGQSDSIEYAWFIWSQYHNGVLVGDLPESSIRVLPAMPKELRKPLAQFALEPTPDQWLKGVY